MEIVVKIESLDMPDNAETHEWIIKTIRDRLIAAWAIELEKRKYPNIQVRELVNNG